MNKNQKKSWILMVAAATTKIAEIFLSESAVEAQGRNPYEELREMYGINEIQKPYPTPKVLDIIRGKQPLSPTAERIQSMRFSHKKSRFYKHRGMNLKRAIDNAKKSRKIFKSTPTAIPQSPQIFRQQSQ